MSRRISARLIGRDAVFGRVIIAAEMIEWAGNLAGALLAGGMIVQAAKQGGKWGLVRLAAKAVAAEAAGRVVNAGLDAAGVDNQKLQGVQLAVTVVSFVILRRKYGGRKSNTPQSTRKGKAKKNRPPNSKIPDEARRPAKRTKGKTKTSKPKNVTSNVAGIVRRGNPSRVEFEGKEFRAVRKLSHLSEAMLRGMRTDGKAAIDINGNSLSIHHQTARSGAVH